MLYYITDDIRTIVHVPMGKDKALAVRVRETRRKAKATYVILQRISMNDGQPFWVERMPRKWERNDVSKALPALKRQMLAAKAW